MSPVAIEIFGRPVYWYGIIISISVMVAIYVAMRNAKKFGIDADMMVDFSLMAIPISIIGARIYYVIFEWDQYRGSLIDIVNIRKGGLAIFGAVLAGIVAGVIFSKWRKINFWNLADIVGPSLILGQAVGRWGNFFNQEAYGNAVNNPAWQWFPAAVFIDAVNRWHLATFFYESMWNFAVFFFLMYYRSKRKIEGELFLLYLILYSCGRLLIEGLRMDSLYWGPFRVSQLLSVILIILAGYLFYSRRKNTTNIQLHDHPDLEDTHQQQQPLQNQEQQISAVDESHEEDQNELNNEKE